MFSIQIAKHAFKKEVFTCFGSVPKILESLEKVEKCSKWLQANWLRVLVLRFLNKFLLKSIEYFKFWENVSSDLMFHVYWKLDYQNWYFSHFGTLRKIRYATVVLIVLYVACLICFLKLQQFDGNNFKKSTLKSTLKSDFTPNFQHWVFFHLKNRNNWRSGTISAQQSCYDWRTGQITRS